MVNTNFSKLAVCPSIASVYVVACPFRLQLRQPACGLCAPGRGLSVLQPGLRPQGSAAATYAIVQIRVVFLQCIELSEYNRTIKGYWGLHAYPIFSRVDVKFQVIWTVPIVVYILTDLQLWNYRTYRYQLQTQTALFEPGYQ